MYIYVCILQAIIDNGQDNGLPLFKQRRLIVQRFCASVNRESFFTELSSIHGVA